jgi:hypothetical protein
MYSREIVDEALRLTAQGVADREVARRCGVSVASVRHWRTGRRRRNGDLGRKRDCPRCNDRPLDAAAYGYLLGLYLGDGHIVRCKREVYQLSIACADAWPGLMDLACATMADVMPGSSVSRRQHLGYTEVKSYSKHWTCLFPQHGPGMKHTRRIGLAEWQQNIVAEYTEEFLRGLIHSDGCRVINRVRGNTATGRRNYEYPRYMFTNASTDILRLFTGALDRLGIAWRRMNERTISIARRGAVARLDEFIGPKY